MAAIRQPWAETLDGLEVRYVRYASPPRGLSYASWGAWAAPALRRLLDHAPTDVIHAHYPVPAGDAARRAAPSTPLVVSVHSHDPLGGGGANARHALTHARVVLANSAGTARRCAAAGAQRVRVVHLGSDLPADPAPAPNEPTLVTVAHLFARKRHADVLAALALLRHRHEALRYEIVGDGPERPGLEGLAASLGLGSQVRFHRSLPPAQAIAAARRATLFVLPSVDEALGVAYLEAMAAGVPAIGCSGEAGPEEIAAAGHGGIVLVPPRSPTALAAQIDSLLTDPARLGTLRQAARATVQNAFTWEQCGRETVAAYRAAHLNASRTGRLT
jgi:glycosyltransferase involved in cell wall biosynthesis